MTGISKILMGLMLVVFCQTTAIKMAMAAPPMAVPLNGGAWAGVATAAIDGKNVKSATGKPANIDAGKKSWWATWWGIDFSLTPSIAYFYYQENKAVKRSAFLIGGISSFTRDAGGIFIRTPIYGFESNLKIYFNPQGIGFVVVPFDAAVYTGQSRVYNEIPANYPYFNQRTLLFWYRFLVGPSFTFLNHYRFNFLLGYGYKYTTQTFTPLSVHYSRQNEINYVPMVLQFQYRGDNFTALVQGEYDIFVGGKQSLVDHVPKTVVINSVYTRTYQDVSYQDTQAKGHGWRTLIEITYQGVTLAPFFNYFSIDDSTPVSIDTTDPDGDIRATIKPGGQTPLYPTAPANITIETGVKVGYQF